MLFMLLDHVRETFYLHLQVPDPMVVADTPPACSSRACWPICARCLCF
jgi:uncharacterized membrane protein